MSGDGGRTHKDKKSIKLLFESFNHIVVYLVCEGIVAADELAAVLTDFVGNDGDFELDAWVVNVESWNGH